MAPNREWSNLTSNQLSNKFYNDLLDQMGGLNNAMTSTTIKMPDLKEFVPSDRFTPKQIIHNENAVIVFWEDSTKTVVRRKEGDVDDVYSAFAQALVKKLFKATTTAHKMVNRVLKTQIPKGR